MAKLLGVPKSRNGDVEAFLRFMQPKFNRSGSPLTQEGFEYNRLEGLRRIKIFTHIDHATRERRDYSYTDAYLPEVGFVHPFQRLHPEDHEVMDVYSRILQQHIILEANDDFCTDFMR